MSDELKMFVFYSALITQHSSLLLGAGAAGATGQEAGAAEDRAALRWIKGNGRLLAALRAENSDLDLLAHAGRLRGGDGGEALVLGLLARLTTLRLVLQSFIVKEDLLARRPDEILCAVHAVD